MSQNALAQLVVKVLAGLLAWVRSQPPKRRMGLYVTGVLLAAVFLMIDHFVPGWRGTAKHLWVLYGPFVVLVIGGLASAHVGGLASSQIRRPRRSVPESDLKIRQD